MADDKVNVAIGDTAEFEGVYPADEKSAQTEKSQKNAFVVDQTVSKTDFMRCNLYYLRRFLGIKELIVFCIFIAAAVLSFVYLNNAIFFIFTGLVLTLLVIAVGLAVFTTLSGWKSEFASRGVVYQKLYFDQEKIKADTFIEGHKRISEEEFLLTKVDKIVVLKDAVYVYPMTAVCFYIKPDAIEDGTFEEFCAYLRRTFPETTFKLRKRVKQYPNNLLTK